jgi:hypothetical protein
MNTRPIEELPADYAHPSYPVKVEGTGHSVKSQVTTDNSVNKTMPWMVLLGILAGVSLGISIGCLRIAAIAERESRLQRLEVDELKVALQVQGIKIHEGSTP